MNGTSETPSFRLRPTVRVEENCGDLFLLSSFPLKAMVLHPSWKPVFDLFSLKDWLALEQILSQMTTGDPWKVESFLEDLLRKGYLEQRGLPALFEFPKVSVIIPVRNRAEEIAACLDSLIQLHYPREKLEIIVVDDASEDQTPEVISRFPVRLISVRTRSQAAFCRNLGAKQAVGEILAFIDSDCVADSLWLRELVPAFRDPVIGVVGGMVDSVLQSSALERYEKVKSSLNMGNWFRRSGDGDRLFYVPSCNLLTKKVLFSELDGFKPDLHVGEDVDYCWRVQDQGYEIEYRPRGRIFHRHRNTLKGFCARRFDYGTSEPLLQKRHETRAKKMVLPTGATVFWLLALLSVLAGSRAIAGLCALSALVYSVQRFQRLRRRGAPVRLLEVVVAMSRSHLSFLYHLSAFFSRYYLAWGVCVLGFMPKTVGVLVAVQLGVGLTEYFLKRPRLDPFSFIVLFSLEQLAYQAGVWWSCVKQRSFTAINPRLAMRLPPE